MIINIIDTFDQINEYRKSNSSFDLVTWKNYVDSISLSLYEKCIANAAEYNFEKDILPVISSALYDGFDEINMAHKNLSFLKNFLQSKIKVLFKVDFDIDIIFYIGLCNGAGWATELDGRKTVLIGAEKIVELGWYETDIICDLVCHEVAHLIHFELRKAVPIPDNRSIWQLYTEGFATRYSQKLYKDGLYHQNQNGWLEFCKTNHNSIKLEYLRRLNSNESTSDFFGDWNSYMGRSELGYYLGCEFVVWLERGYSVNEIACMLPDKLEHLLLEFLEDLI